MAAALLQTFALAVFMVVDAVKRQAVVGDNQPHQPLRQRWGAGKIMAGVGMAVVDDAAIPIGLRLHIVAPLCQARQPLRIGGAAVNHGLKQA